MNNRFVKIISPDRAVNMFLVLAVLCIAVTVHSDPPPRRDWTKQIRHNTNFGLESRYQNLGHKRQVDGRLTWATSATKGPHQLGLAAWLAYGSATGLYGQQGHRLGLAAAAPKRERRRRWAELDELFWTVGWGDVDFTLGKRQDPDPSGLATDRLAPQDLNEPTSPRPYSRWLLAFELYNGDTAFDLSLFPFFIPSQRPAATSPWHRTPDGSGQGFYFSGPQSGSRGETRPRGPAQTLLTLNYRAYRSLGNWDLGLAWGPDQYPVLGQSRRADPLPVRRYVRKTYLFGGLTRTTGPVEAETRITAQLSGNDDRFLTGSFGLHRSFGPGNTPFFKWLDLKASWGGEWIFTDLNGPEHSAKHNTKYSAKKSRPNRNDLGASIRLSRPATDLSLGLDHFFADDSFMLHVALRHQRGPLGTRIGGEIFGGTAGYYGRWDRNDRLLLDLDYSW